MQKNIRILLVYKLTRLERDLIHYGSKSKLAKLYYSQNNSYERIYTAHKRQLQNLKELRQLLKSASFILRAELPFVEKKNFDLIISYGGDNHFVYVSSFAGQKPILGLNSDPLSSTGSLLYFTPTLFFSTISNITSHLQIDEKKKKQFFDYCIFEKWTRIQGTLKLPKQRKKIKIGPCVAEISIHNVFHDYISRFLLRRNAENWEEIKCSGYLLVNGAGSTGWYRNAHFAGKEANFPKDALFFRALARESNYQQRHQLRYLNPTIQTNEQLEIISIMDSEIIVDANPYKAIPFPAGSQATFFLSKERLNVIKKIKLC